MVIKRTSLSPEVSLLRVQLRELLYPFTAIKFQEVNKNKLKDLVKTGENFGVKNFILLSENENNCYLKFLQKDQKGLVFKIKSFSLVEDFVKINGNKLNIDYHNLGIPLVLCKGFD
jgi:hypothetical protein